MMLYSAIYNFPNNNFLKWEYIGPMDLLVSPDFSINTNCHFFIETMLSCPYFSEIFTITQTDTNTIYFIQKNKTIEENYAILRSRTNLLQNLAMIEMAKLFVQPDEFEAFIKLLIMKASGDLVSIILHAEDFCRDIRLSCDFITCVEYLKFINYMLSLSDLRIEKCIDESQNRMIKSDNALLNK